MGVLDDDVVIELVYVLLLEVVVPVDAVDGRIAAAVETGELDLRVKVGV